MRTDSNRPGRPRHARAAAATATGLALVVVAAAGVIALGGQDGAPATSARSTSTSPPTSDLTATAPDTAAATSPPEATTDVAEATGEQSLATSPPAAAPTASAPATAPDAVAIPTSPAESDTASETVTGPPREAADPSDLPEDSPDAEPGDAPEDSPDAGPGDPAEDGPTAECSTGAYTPGSLPTDGLPVAVAATAGQLLEAAMDCDQDLLIERANQDGTVLSFGPASAEEALSIPQEDPRYLVMAALLTRTSWTVDDSRGVRLYTWPAAALPGSATEQHWSELREAGIHDPQLEETMRRNSHYDGWRVSITESGQWRLLIAGD